MLGLGSQIYKPKRVAQEQEDPFELQPGASIKSYNPFTDWSTVGTLLPSPSSTAIGDIAVTLAAADRNLASSISDITLSNFTITNNTTGLSQSYPDTFVADSEWNFANIIYTVFDSGSLLDDFDFSSTSSCNAKHDGTATNNSFTLSATIDIAGNVASLSTVISHADAKKHVFLLAGQSNMVGKAADDGVPYVKHVSQYAYSTSQLGTPYSDTSETEVTSSPLDHWDSAAGDMGLAKSFARSYRESTHHKVVFIPAAKGATGFVQNQWNKGDVYYEHAVDATNAFMAAHPDYQFSGILWHQGEQDYQNTSYPQQLYRMFSEMREDITSCNNPFGQRLIAGYVVPSSGGGPRDTAILQDAILNNSPQNEYVRAADSNGLTGIVGEEIHFDSSSLTTLGQRYYSSWVTAAYPPTGNSSNLLTNDWYFGYSNQLLRSREADWGGPDPYALTEQGAAPTYDYSVTTINGAQGNALISPWTSGNTGSFTAALVFKYSSSGGHIIMGTLSTATGEQDGWGMFVSAGGDLRANFRDLGTSTQTIQTAANLVNGNYYFAAITCDGTNVVTYVSNGTNTLTQTTFTGTIVNRNPAPRNIAVGNASFNNVNFSNDVEVAWFGVAQDTYMSSTDVADLYFEAGSSSTDSVKENLSARNITV